MEGREYERIESIKDGIQQQGNDQQLPQNRDYNRREIRLSISMDLFSPLEPEKEFKVYNSCKCLQILRSTSQ